METTSEETKPPAKSSQLEKIEFNITEPVKLENLTMEIRNLNVFVGANGTGKSLILKILYAVGSVGLGANAPMAVGGTEGAQFIFDHTFSNQNFNGTMKAIYSSGFVSVTLDNGKVTDVKLEGLENPTPVVFLSTEMRTFDAMTTYLRMRKLATDKNNPMEKVTRLLEAYKLYDITYMESLITRCPIIIPKPIVDVLRSTYDFNENIVSLAVDEENCAFYVVLDDGTKKDVTTYGHGHQAVLNMMIGVGA